MHEIQSINGFSWFCNTAINELPRDFFYEVAFFFNEEHLSNLLIFNTNSYITLNCFARELYQQIGLLYHDANIDFLVNNNGLETL